MLPLRTRHLSAGALACLLLLFAAPLKAQRKDLNLADLIEQVEPSVVMLKVVTPNSRGMGSGFVVDSRGWIITNYNVINGAVSAVAKFNDDREVKVLGYMAKDPLRDLAILKIDIARDFKRVKALPLAGGEPRKGERTVAIGSPSGLSFTATEGIISAIRRGSELRNFGKIADGTWLQTSTPISPGSNGGPLLNLRGEVVGVNTGSLSDAQNVNFAVSSEDILVLLKSAATARLTELYGDPVPNETAQADSGPRSPRTSRTFGSKKPRTGAIEIPPIKLPPPIKLDLPSSSTYKKRPLSTPPPPLRAPGLPTLP